mmetsp:Transcript_60288/g.187099  ORF Transcript_60288/g.187099 Transcript_60288/m.187099 type:complete len:251 (+) Transcript_60288:398-1150(+)
MGLGWSPVAGHGRVPRALRGRCAALPFLWRFVHDLLQQRGRLHKGGPAVYVPVDAEQRKRREARGGEQRPLRAGIQALEHTMLAALLVGLQLIPKKEAAIAVRCHLRRQATGEEFHEDHTEGVDLIGLRHHASLLVQGVRVAQRAHDLVHGKTTGTLERLHARKAKVRDLRCSVRTKENVLGLDVAVEDLGPVPVQVRQPSGHANGRLQPLPPGERRLARVQPHVRVAPRQELVDERTLADSAAMAGPRR